MSAEGTLIIDAQVFQSEAWDRGMGKYSLHFLEALLNQPGFPYKKAVVIFNKNLKLQPTAEETLRQKLSNVEFVWLDLKLPKMVPREKLEPLLDANTKILDKFIAEQGKIKPSFIILAPFIDSLCSVFPTNVEKIALVYDLIPLLYSERYSKSHMYQNYLQRFQLLLGADKLLTISQTVADDVAVYTGIDPAKITNIDGAPIHREGLTPQKPDIELPANYFIMPSGDELRKNNFRAVEAFEEYRKASGNMDSRLVLTSHFQPKTQKALNSLSSALIFSGNVSEAELLWLYQNAVATVFVSEYEGLGLPVLEAVETGKPVVCSNLTVFNEMSSSAFYYADEQNVASITETLQRAAASQDFAAKRKEYPAILKRYTWQETAKKALNALAQPLPAASNDKPRLAIFAPDPAGYSSIGRITQLMHPTLSRYFKIDYYLEKTREGNTFSRPCYLAEIANIYPSSYFNAKRYADYDAVLYHLGNSEYHLDTIKNALHLPGFIITHDLNLTNVFEGVLGRFAYMEPQRLAAERTLDELLKTTKTSRLTSLVNASLGAITHSKYAAEAVSEIDQHGSLPILSTQLPTAVPKLDRVNLEGRFKLGFGGIINPVKGVSLVDQIINSDDLRQVDIHIFGIPLMSPAELDRLQSLPNVTVETNLSDFAFESRLSAMDAIVNYRPQYNGESSQTVIDALRYGVVPIVRRIGWFDELPDDCVEKVDSEDEVLAAVTRLVTKADYLKQKKQAAKQYAVDTYGYERYADQLQKFIIDNYSNAKTPNGKLAAAIRAGAKKSDLLKQLKG